MRTVAGPLRTMRPYADLFFMGAAFLLLETKNVVQFALLFGTTWAVNAAVFAGVLLSVLAAIEVARRVTIRRPVLLYAALLAALAAAWLIPQDALLDLSLVPRFLAGVTIAFLPIFIANLLFAVRFKGAGSSTIAFGANLLGAMVGGALEYLALIFGFNTLLVVVALLYGLALLTGYRHLVGAARTPLTPGRDGTLNRQETGYGPPHRAHIRSHPHCPGRAPPSALPAFVNPSCSSVVCGAAVVLFSCRAGGAVRQSCEAPAPDGEGDPTGQEEDADQRVLRGVRAGVREASRDCTGLLRGGGAWCAPPGEPWCRPSCAGVAGSTTSSSPPSLTPPSSGSSVGHSGPAGWPSVTRTVSVPGLLVDDDAAVTAVRPAVAGGLGGPLLLDVGDLFDRLVVRTGDGVARHQHLDLFGHGLVVDDLDNRFVLHDVRDLRHGR